MFSLNIWYLYDTKEFVVQLVQQKFDFWCLVSIQYIQFVDSDVMNRNLDSNYVNVILSQMNLN